jgi:hypothetical protein
MLYMMLIYTNLPTITAALYRIIHENVTREHRTSTATSGLIQHYYPINRYITTPETMLDTGIGTFKKPDYIVETLNSSNKLYNVVYVEVKSLINSNFNDILDQLYDSILYTVDADGGDFSAFIIAMKGTKIAFFHFSSYVSLLEELGIPNYKGFTPLNYILSTDN